MVLINTAPAPKVKNRLGSRLLFFTYHNDGSRRTPACNIAIESGSPAAPQATGPPLHRPVSACRATRALPTEPLTREGCTWSPCCFVGACEKHTHVPHRAAPSCARDMRSDAPVVIVASPSSSRGRQSLRERPARNADTAKLICANAECTDTCRGQDARS